MTGFLSAIWQACGEGATDDTGKTVLQAVRFHGDESLPSVFAVSDLAAEAVASAGAATAEWIQARFGSLPHVQVDRRLSSLWFARSIEPQGWALDPSWDPVAGDYATRDGWIKLHTNARHHRDAALGVLGVEVDRAQVRAAVAKWSGDELEQAIVDQGGCAARLRSMSEWAVHPQGRALQTGPLIERAGEAESTGTGRPSRRAQADGEQPVSSRDPAPGQPNREPSRLDHARHDHARHNHASQDHARYDHAHHDHARHDQARRDRPLAGYRVLDLTRVLAGPACTRYLAGLGADVLRIDPAWWQEAGLEPETTLGKHCATLNLRSAQGLARLWELIAQADVLIHGWRPGAMAGLGLDEAARRALNPQLVDVSLDAYGWNGPWQGRRGFDSLVQMSCGIAHEGMVQAGVDHPVPLPVQALDHATGYILACAALRGLTRQLTQQTPTTARASLVQTAALLVAGPRSQSGDTLSPAGSHDYADHIEQTPWGPARRLKPPVVIEGCPVHWDRPARRFRSDPAQWAQP